jgi:DNA-binding beta-propeller fold protein YncE
MKTNVVNPLRKLTAAATFISAMLAATPLFAQPGHTQGFRAPAGTLPTTRQIAVDGYNAAVLPNGRFITPVGTEASVQAPKPFGMALSPDGNTLATINSGIGPFSITLVGNLNSNSPAVRLIPVNATFLGVVFSPDSSRFYASGGENGNIWVGETASAKIVGSVNLNGPSHPYGSLNVISGPTNVFKGTFPGKMAITGDGKYLYVTDQGGFQVLIVDTTKIVVGVDGNGNLSEADNFAALAGSVKAGRYPFGIALSPDNQRLYVTNVGLFQYTHLLPPNPTGDNNIDFPLCYPGAGYPNESENDRLIQIHKVDPRNLQPTLSVPDGVRCGYVSADQTYNVPGLGSPNVPESSSVYVFDTSNRLQPSLLTITKTGLQIGDTEDHISAYGGSHPNAVIVGKKFVYVANGNNDSISVLSKETFAEVTRIDLSLFQGVDHHIKGLQPVSLASSPDEKFLYVAEAGINAIAVVQLRSAGGDVLGLIPAGWWPSTVQVSASGNTLYMANANGRGAGPNNILPPNNLGSPKSSTIGTLNIVPVPSREQLAKYTKRVLVNNGFLGEDGHGDSNSIHGRPAAFSQIKHIIFINKENATHDLLLGDITQTRKGVPVNGDPNYSLGVAASPNHHELALEFAFSDNFYLEPSVSSDGHRWLTNTYTSEFEQTHWPASYGGKRNDAGDDPNVFGPYPGRLGFTDANSSPDPQDYTQHGGIYLHLVRNGKSFVNFGNGYEFAEVDESDATDPTGIRNHVNVPMESVVRDNSDQAFPEFNTHIPDAPLAEDPTRFNRFGRFRQVFEANYVDRQAGVCKLPNYVDLYYPNDHGGGPTDIHPAGPAWDFVRFVQDNDGALGLTAELISHSPCWKDTAIFVVEDDPQNGFDHVDGTRSIFLAISPWIKREYVSKTHLSLASIFKTVNEILDMPPLNQYDAAATDLRDLFTNEADFAPYDFTAIPFAAHAKAAWGKMTQGIDFSKPDANEVQLRRAIALSEGIPHRKPGKK